MSDPTSKPPSIPSWQQRSGSGSADSSAPSSPSPSPSSDDAPASTSRQDLVDQASRFLEDDSIRDAPTDHKIAFLESKGLDSDEIQQLLGVSRNAEASSTSPESQHQGPETPPTSEQSEVTPYSSVTAASTSSTMPQPVSSTSRDVAPIITYPEFLAQPSKPPPLVTMRNIFYTLYGAAGLSTSIYGASEYLVKPMLANLTAARHDLATTAQENLQKLNEKLEQNVSVIPAHLNARKSDANESTEDNDSVTSDPTELFHRDIGTQTTPNVTPPSLSSSKDTHDSAISVPVTAVNNHMSRIESIQAQLKEAGDAEKDSSSLDDSLRRRLTDLHHYLDGMIYAAPSYTAAGSAYGLYNAGTTAGSDGSATGLRKAENEAIASFKAEIRGVKGALLSARNFPAGRGGRLGGLSASAR
ncbi:peroxin [Penicillium capsulatum]|uniref:Peroxisomal membrane protein PEX14 n=1 Tax=Penicillium capsulatum TaxID=69766 RepID=A0A9W9ICU7_9EURO|nr:peroxin [Penicillium capsulatum]KAJ6134936.1 peroxin Pex14/17-Penicillium chrysogenum [Penicillium capsulatum]